MLFLWTSFLASVSAESLFEYNPPTLILDDRIVVHHFQVRLKTPVNESVSPIYFTGDGVKFAECSVPASNEWQNVTLTTVPDYTKPGIQAVNLVAKTFVGENPYNETYVCSRYVAPAGTCSSIGDPHNLMFNGHYYTANSEGTYNLINHAQFTVQVTHGLCGYSAHCNKVVAFRYGNTVMALDVRGPAEILQTISGDAKCITYQRATDTEPSHKVIFPCGSQLNMNVFRGGERGRRVDVTIDLAAGFSSADGACGKIGSAPGFTLRNGTNFIEGQGERTEAFMKEHLVEGDAILLNGKVPVDTAPIEVPMQQCELPEKTTVIPKKVDPPVVCPPYVAPEVPIEVPAYEAPKLPAGFEDQVKSLCNEAVNVKDCVTVVDKKPFVDACIADSITAGSLGFIESTKAIYQRSCQTILSYGQQSPDKKVAETCNKAVKAAGFGTYDCPKACSEQGKCTDSGCNCKPGYTGSDCSMNLAALPAVDTKTGKYSDKQPENNFPQQETFANAKNLDEIAPVSGNYNSVDSSESALEKSAAHVAISSLAFISLAAHFFA